MKPSLLIAVFGAVLVSGCSRHPNGAASQPAPRPTTRVHVIQVTAEDVPTISELTGVVRAVRRAQIAAKVMGAIEDIPLALGQSVRQSEVLVKISAGEISARVSQAQSQLNAARRDVLRERDLLAKGASTADTVRGLEDRFAGAEALVREAEAMLGYATIRAPFDGVVARKFANTGDLASPGMLLLELEDTRAFEVEVGLPDSLAGRVRRHAAVSVEIPSMSTTFTGEVTEVSSAAESGAHTVLAKVQVPQGTPVRSGQFARVLIQGAAVPTLVVPASAVTRHGQMERVFIASDANVAILRLVKTGAHRGDRMEILAGLDPAERIVLAPPLNLREGQPLEVIQ